MSAPTAVRPAASAPGTPDTGGFRWISAVAAGLSVLLAGSCLVAVVQGTGWLLDALGAVAVVVVLGIALQRLAPAVVVLGQLAGLLLLLTARYSDGALAGVLPTPAVFRSFGSLMGEAVQQIDTGIAPVVPTPGALFLIATAFGVLAVLVHAISVLAGAPAAGAVPLLALVAVPAALSDPLLPWWTVTLAALGYGVLLVARDGMGRRGGAPVGGGVAVVAIAAIVGLLLGSAATVVGTSGRFTSSSGHGGSGGEIGLNPFTSLRGQLNQSQPVELFRATGLPRPTYLRALTLATYRANTGWEAGAPRPGVPLSGPLTPDGAPGDRVSVRMDNLGFRDYWLPLYGQPDSVTGVDAARWSYDQSAGIAYSQRPRQENSWQETAVLPAPSAGQLRAAAGPARVDPAYLDTSGVDPRVRQIAADATRGAATPFDKSVALVEYFTGPQTQFRYSLQTAPGNGDDALVEFLTRGKTGYCEQFASAMAVMLRTVGVPARVAVGFTAGTDANGARTVTTSDAHAWVEAWFPGYGWTTFDPTPLTDGRTIVPPYVQEAVGPGPQGGQTPVPQQQQDLSPQSAPQDQAPNTAFPQPDPNQAGPVVGTTGQYSVWPLVFGLVVLLVLALLAVPRIVRAVLGRRRLAAAAAGGPGSGSAAWAELVALSRDRGATLDDGDTVRGTARAIVGAHEIGPEPREALQELVRLVEGERYGGEQPGPGVLTPLLAELRTAIRATPTARHPLRWLVPPSLVAELRGRRDRPAVLVDD